MELTTCPREFVGDDTAEVSSILEAVEFSRETHHLPVVGGYLDQAAACVEGMRVAFAARREIEERLRTGKMP